MPALVVFFLVSIVPGERLDYDVRYGPIRLGTLALLTLGSDTVDSTPCYRLRAELRISRSFSWLFWADYRLESWCRGSDMVTLRSYKRTREPRYRAEWTAEFDPAADSVRYSDGGRYAVPDSCRDLLTVWYLLRESPVPPGETSRVRMHVDRRNYDVAVARAGARSIETRAGLFECVAMVPSAGAPLGTVYLSNDTTRVPVVIRARVNGFAISAYLRRIGSLEEED